MNETLQSIPVIVLMLAFWIWRWQRQARWNREMNDAIQEGREQERKWAEFERNRHPK